MSAPELLGVTDNRPYQSLYRRYRPQRFNEVLGQDHVVLALRHAVRDERVSHAYLFSGPRGTGKTSTARILAKALNCENPLEGEPCDVCASCVAISEGNSFDVHELDAASNNGVEPMRDLVARASLSTPGRWKVYIIDEVHMLSSGASNALLKTLEEPPDHVVFVLATTDPQKVLATIRSRTQHFEFRLLGEDVLTTLLETVAISAKLELPDRAITTAMRRAKGSARDALSVLDQVVAAGVIDDDTDTLSIIVSALGEQNAAVVLQAVDEAIRQGRDPQLLAVELVERLRAGFLSILAPGTARTEATPSDLEALRELGAAGCVRAMEMVGHAITAMRDTPEPRVTLEVALLRCCHPQADDSNGAILERLERLEHRINELGQKDAAPAVVRDPVPVSSETNSPEPTSHVASPADQPVPNQPARGQTDEPTARPSGGRPALGAFRTRRALSNTTATSPPVVEPRADTEAPKPTASIQQPPPPSRDELVTAWGDHLLTSLRPRVRAVFQAGRFLGSDSSGVTFALPNEAHLVHALPLKGEVELTLTTYFKRPLSLQLVIDAVAPVSAPPPRSAPGASTEKSPDHVADVEEPHEDDYPEAHDPPTPQEPHSGASLAEDRLRRAFPGVEEVEPT